MSEPTRNVNHQAAAEAMRWLERLTQKAKPEAGSAKMWAQQTWSMSAEAQALLKASQEDWGAAGAKDPLWWQGDDEALAQAIELAREGRWTCALDPQKGKAVFIEAGIALMAKDKIKALEALLDWMREARLDVEGRLKEKVTPSKEWKMDARAWSWTPPKEQSEPGPKIIRGWILKGPELRGRMDHLGEAALMLGHWEALRAWVKARGGWPKAGWIDKVQQKIIRDAKGKGLSEEQAESLAQKWRQQRGPGWEALLLEQEAAPKSQKMQEGRPSAPRL